MFKIIFFGSDGCPDCEEQKRILETNFDSHEFVYIDIDSNLDSDQELMAKYNIDNPPTLLVIKQVADGKSRIFRHTGILSASKIRKFVDNF
jgi:glutaredoxin